MAQDHLVDGVLAHGAAWAGLVATLAAGAVARPSARRPLLVAGAGLLACGGALFVVNGALAFTGSLDPYATWTVLVGTRYGHALGSFLVAATLGGVAVAARRERVALVPLGAAVAALGTLGHGSSQGTWSTLAIVHLVHGAAVCLWMGGVLALSARLADGERPGEALARFSSRAVVWAALVLGSGGLLLVRYGAVEASPYTGALVLKLLFVALVLSLALANRRRLARLDAPGAWAALDRGLFLELAAAATVGGLAALLSQLEPP